MLGRKNYRQLDGQLVALHLSLSHLYTTLPHSLSGMAVRKTCFLQVVGCVCFALFQHTLKTEMGIGASCADIQDKYPDATSACAPEELNQWLL